MTLPISEQVRSKYPTPIALRYQRMEEDQSFHRKFLLLLDVFEVTTRYISLTLIAQYIHEEQKSSSEEMNRLLASRFLKHVSLGDWVHLIQEIVRIAFVENRPLFWPEIKSIYSKSETSFKISSFASDMENFVKIRNQYKGHGIVEEEETYEKLYHEYHPLMDKILAEFSFLESSQLVVSAKADTQVQYHLFEGASPQLLPNPIPEVESQTHDENAKDLVWNIYQGKVCCLWPLFVFPVGLEDWVYLFDGCRLSGQKKLQQMKFIPFRRRLSSLTYRSGRQGKEVVESLAGFVARMQEHLPQRSRQEISYYLDSMKADIEFHTKTFVGREYVEEQINTFTANHLCGYYVIYGNPGQGKSALSANLIAKRNFSHHLIKVNTPRANVTRLLQSLLEQLQSKYSLKRSISNTQGDLREKLTATLHEISNRLPEGQQEIILIDALDELAEEDQQQLTFLPTNLPPKVFIILTSRPIPSVKRLAVQVPKHEHQLEPLRQEEIQKLFSNAFITISENDLQQIEAISQGNPLYLQLLIRESKWDLNLQQLPSGLESLFRQIFERLADHSHGDDLLRVLAVLSVAKRGLTLQELANILTIRRRRLKEILQPLEPFLIERGGEWSIFHLKFQEHLLVEELEEEEITEAHQFLIDYCLPWEEKQLTYGYENLTYHYFENKQYSKIFDLTKSNFLIEKSKNLTQESCLHDLRLAFEAAVLSKDTYKILYYGLLFGSAQKSVSAFIESGQFILSAIEGDSASSIREIQGSKDYRLRMLATFALAETFCYQGNTSQALEVIQPTLEQKVIQLNESELYWWSRFVGRFILPLDQTLAIRLSKLSRQAFGQSQRDQEKHLEQMASILVEYAAEAENPVEALKSAFTISEAIPQKNATGDDNSSFIGQIQSNIVKTLMAFDLETAEQLAQEIRHLGHRAYIGILISRCYQDDNPEKAKEWHRDVCLYFQDAAGADKLFGYVNIIRGFYEIIDGKEAGESALEFKELCLENLKSIADITQEERDIFMLKFLPYLVTTHPKETQQLLAEIREEAPRARAMARIGSFLIASDSKDWGQDYILQGIELAEKFSVEKYRIYVLEEISNIANLHEYPKILSAIGGLIDGIQLPNTQARGYIILAAKLESVSVSKADYFWNRAWETILLLHREWEKKDLLFFFLKNLAHSEMSTWKKWSPCLIPHLDSYSRAIAYNIGHFEKKCTIESQKNTRVSFSAPKLTNDSQILLGSWLANISQDGQDLEALEKCTNESTEIEDDILAQTAKHLASSNSKLAMDYLSKIESHIIRVLALFRLLPKLEKIPSTDFIQAVEKIEQESGTSEDFGLWYLPESYKTISRWILDNYDAADQEQLLNFFIKQLRPMKDHNQAVGLLHLASGLLPEKKDTAFALVEEVEQFLYDIQFSEDDWRNTDYYREKVWAYMVEVYAPYDIHKAKELSQNVEATFFAVFALLAYYSKNQKEIFIEKFLSFLENNEEPLERSGILVTAARSYFVDDPEKARKLRNRAALEGERCEDSLSRALVLLRVASSSRSLDEAWASKRVEEIFQSVRQYQREDPETVDQFLEEIPKSFMENPPFWTAQANEKWQDWVVQSFYLIQNPSVRGRCVVDSLKIFEDRYLEEFQEDFLRLVMNDTNSFISVYTHLWERGVLKDNRPESITDYRALVGVVQDGNA